MRAVANSLSARYLISISVIGFGDKVSMKASVLDPKTGKILQSEQTNTGGGDQALDGAESLARKLLADLSSLLKQQCEPHWTGSVTWAHKEEAGSRETSACRRGLVCAVGEEIESITTYTWKVDEAVEAVLMPMSLGSEGPDSPMAGFAHSFRNQTKNSNKTSGKKWCRFPN